MVSPKLSIIIPTRNGGDYVCAAVETVLSQPYEPVELIVSVNHSTDDTLARLGGFGDPRLRIVIPPRPLSMPKHFEWCIHQAQGEWITILGDDDGVMPYFFKEFEQLIARWQSHRVDAYCFRRACYFWPGCEAVYGNNVLTYTASVEERVWPSLSTLISTLAGTNVFYDLPQLYTNNIVRRKLIDQIRSCSGGEFIHELNPDVYSGVAIALLAKRVIRVELPFFWTGSSPKSVGLSSELDRRRQPAEGTKAAATSATDFHAMAAVDGLKVADEIGLRAWTICGSSALFTASALLRIPFSMPLLLRWRRFIVALAVSTARREVNPREVSRDAKIEALNDIAERNRLNPCLTALAECFGFGCRQATRIRNVFVRLRGALRYKPGGPFPNLYVSTRKGHDSLIDANITVSRACGIDVARSQIRNG